MQILYYSLDFKFFFRKITFLDSAAASNFAAAVAAYDADSISIKSHILINCFK